MKQQLEILANELLHEIFDYLSPYDLIKGFQELNKRFSHLISQRLFKCDFSHLSKLRYENLLEILPFNRISSLKISHKWTLNILPRISFNLMHNLQVLTLSHISYNELGSLFQSNDFFRISQQLTTLKIQSTNINSVDRERLFVLQKIFSQMPKLRRCQIPLIDVNDFDDLIPISTLEELLIDYCTMICLDRLLDYIPSVQLLIVRIHPDLSRYPSRNSSPSSYANLRLLEISTVNNIPFHQLETFFEKNAFPRLDTWKFFFKTDASSQSCLDYLDDKRWEVLLRSLIALVRFDCSLELPVQSKSIDNSFERNDYFLRRDYRLDFHISTYSFNTILYVHTKPYPKRRLDLIPSKAFSDNSVNKIYFRVRDLHLLIDPIPLMRRNSISTRMIYENLRSLTLISNTTLNESLLLLCLSSIIPSTQLRYLTIQLDKCSKHFLSNLIEIYSRIVALTISSYHSWSKLIQLASRMTKSSIRSLIVYEAFLDFNQYESLQQLFNQLEILSVVVTSVEDAYRFLALLFLGNQRSTLENLRSLTIKCDFNEPDAIAHWIRTNVLRKFSYKCTTNLLTIWL